jgi:GNAT superfamily N-acetyltransferase
MHTCWSKITGKKMKNTEIKQFTELSEILLAQLVTLEAGIFEKPLTSGIFSAELDGKKNLLILVAFQDARACAYKIGFEYSSNTFFSWSGVLPDCRKCGLGSALIANQHQVAKKLGYSYVRTHTKNKYREMLILNIKAGFNVTGVYKSLQEAHPGIILEKAL